MVCIPATQSQQDVAAALKAQEAAGLLSTMTKFLLLTGILAVAVTALGGTLAQQGAAVTVVKYEFEPNTGNGEYSFSYELSDGTTRSERGVLQNAGTPDEFLLVTGDFRWMSPDGQWTSVTYTADADGYHPKVQLAAGGGLSGSLVASLVG